MTEETETRPAEARHTRAAERSEIVPLEWPIEFEGKTWTAIEVRRMTVGEISAYLSKFKDGELVRRFPMFDAPEPVLDALDGDDEDKLTEVAGRFLPQRFRATERPEG